MVVYAYQQTSYVEHEGNYQASTNTWFCEIVGQLWSVAVPQEDRPNVLL